MKLWSIAAILLAASATLAETLTVTVTTEGPRKGMIDILVFNSKKGFPNKPGRAFRRVRFPVNAKGPIECSITNLPYGSYSLSILHDINGNSKADKVLGMGPPTEPIGFSNFDRKPRKKPRYEETVFAFGPQACKTTVALWYAF